MKLKELYIENFGKLSKFKLAFSDGMNSFTAENGYGKTTLSVFIKAMLYGLDDTRRQSLDENERKKYNPWQGGAFGGYLIFEVGGKTYRVERTFSQRASEDTFKLYELGTGKESRAFSSSLGEEIFGIDADGFERTVFLSEKNLSGKNTNPTISAKLSDLVGTEGDIGGFDDAIKLLDERRRFYQKRGGTGEIREIETETSELEDKINALYEMQKGSAKIEARLSELQEQILSLKAKKESIAKKEREEKRKREKQGYEMRYSEMLGALKSDEEREGELLKFFERKLPTNSEMAYASENVSEIYLLKSKLSELGENSELKDLREFFSADTSVEECEKMKLEARRVSECRAEVITGAAHSQIRSPFKRIPTRDEIEAHARSLKEAKNSPKPQSIAFSALGILVALAGALGGYFISSVIYPLAICGILLTLVVILPIFSQKNAFSKSDELQSTLDFIFEVYGENKIFHSAEDALSTMERDLYYYLEKAKDHKSVGADYNPLGDILTQERKLREFCEKFPKADGLTLEEKTEIISYKRHRYEMLLEFEADKESERASCNEKLRILCERLYEFISLFPTTSEDPIEEIRRNLAEYEVIRASLDRRRADANAFATSHGVDLTKEITPKVSTITNDDFTKTLAEIEDRLIALEREKTRAESEYNLIARELEGMDELREMLAEKRERIRLFRENLTVITKTKDYLARARDSMTARYLDSTKRGFEKYVSLFDEMSADFTIDTSFSYMKTEIGGSRQAESYSRGVRDMHALAMRLAIVDSLYSSELPPMILDDPFTSFDDAHVERATRILRKLAEDRQILYFTCSTARKIK